ncbi:unnamed protein product, partial [marine sediment metagenome]
IAFGKAIKECSNRKSKACSIPPIFEEASFTLESFPSTPSINETIKVRREASNRCPLRKKNVDI